MKQSTKLCLVCFFNSLSHITHIQYVMKKATLLHNPNAGEKDFSKEELLKIIRKNGIDVSYASVKNEDWDQFTNDTDFLIIAGGDGTIRRVTKALMKRPRIEKQYPLAILPHGTANNIASTLGIAGTPAEIIKSWHQPSLKKFDIGIIQGMDKDMFFLEGCGFGIFPRLMKVMEKMKEEVSDRVENKLKVAQAILYDIVLNYKSQSCKIVADGIEQAGKFIMVEVLNTRSIGPNLELSSHSDPGDGEFEIVLIPDEHKDKFANYLLNQINGGDELYSFTVLKAKKIEIEWEGKDVHVDDERLKPTESVQLAISVQPAMIEFLVRGA